MFVEYDSATASLNAMAASLSAKEQITFQIKFKSWIKDLNEALEILKLNGYDDVDEVDRLTEAWRLYAENVLFLKLNLLISIPIPKRELFKDVYNQFIRYDEVIKNPNASEEKLQGAGNNSFYGGSKAAEKPVTPAVKSESSATFSG